MATSDATITLTFTDSTQGAADIKRNLCLRDAAKELGLAIYQSDGVTVDNTKVAPALRDWVADRIRSAAIAQRASVSAASTRSTETTNIGNP